MLSEMFRVSGVSGLGRDKKAKDAEAADPRRRIQALEEKAIQDASVIAVFQEKVMQLSTNFDHLGGEVLTLRSASAGIETLSEKVSGLKTQIAQKQSDLVVEQLLMDLTQRGIQNPARRCQVGIPG
jgi:hypothetical protein